MPPPTTSTKRMTANPTRPARYRPGKPTGDSGSSDGSGDEAGSASGTEGAPAARPAQSQAPPKASSFPADGAKRIAQNLRHVDLDARRREGEARERARRQEELEAERAGRERMEMEAGFVTESESGSGSGDESAEEDSDTKIDDVARMGGVAAGRPRRAVKASGSDDEDSDEEEEDDDDSDDSDDDSSSDDGKPKFQRPVFVPKSQRTAAAAAGTSGPGKLATHALPSSTVDAATRQSRTDALVEAKLAEAAAARAAGRKEWDDDEAGEAEGVDDTDGLDVELEHQQWVARELGRLKRARAALEEREAELAEVERRRGLSAAERAAEDEAVLAEQREAKDGRAKAGYLARYHHRGAFFREDAEREGVFGRDLMGARFADESSAGKDVLPEYLQVRDATRIGRKGRTRYKDLRSEDTGQWGEFRDGKGRGSGAGGSFIGDERFRPDWQGGGGTGQARDRVTGANANPVGDRKRGGQEEREDEAKRVKRDDR